MSMLIEQSSFDDELSSVTEQEHHNNINNNHTARNENGVLIIPADDHEFDLSYDGTVPSDVGSLSEANDDDARIAEAAIWKQHGRIKLVVAVLMLASISSNAYAWRERLQMVDQVQALQQKVLHLEQQTVHMHQSKQQRDGENNSSNNHAFTCPGSDETRKPLLLDNCWVKARVDVKLADCANEATEKFKEHVGAWTDAWHEAAGGVQMGLNEEQADTVKTEQEKEAMWKQSGINMRSIKEAGMVLLSGLAFAAFSSLLLSALQAEDSPESVLDQARNAKRWSNFRK
jgi:hypothetical protein